MRFTIFLLLAAFVAGVSWPTWSVGSSLPPTAGPPGAGGTYSPATSCASSGCHGGQDQTRPGSEYSTWVTGDPHAKAYRVLLNEDSKRIAANLKIGKAHEAAVCLACHAVDAPKVYDGELVANQAHAEGVACDACHGASGAWLSAHYQPGWKTLSDREKADRYGFTPTKNLVSRSLACAGCHVGEPGRDVNHDLIAAGHPRLSFEYTKYHFNPRYTKHWVEPTPNPAFEVRAWFVGQVTALRAAVNLLAHRAGDAGGPHPWPELAEWSCYSCHQGLNPDLLRSAGGNRPKGRPAGLPGWQLWYTALVDLLPDAAAVCAPGAPAPQLPTLRKLRDEMGKANPRRAETAKLAAQARGELDSWLRTLEEGERAARPTAIPADQLTQLGHALAKSALTADRAAVRDYDWDFAGQHALGLTAVYHAAGGSEPGSPLADWKPGLTAVREALSFPRPPAGRLDSPKGYDPRAAAEGFRRLLTLTDTGKGQR